MSELLEIVSSYLTEWIHKPNCVSYYFALGKSFTLLQLSFYWLVVCNLHHLGDLFLPRRDTSVESHNQQEEYYGPKLSVVEMWLSCYTPLCNYVFYFYRCTHCNVENFAIRRPHRSSYFVLMTRETSVLFVVRHTQNLLFLLLTLLNFVVYKKLHFLK